MAAGDYNPVNKRIVYVGGLSEEVDQKIVQGAFLPFGDIVDISMPLDYETEKHRGFGFVEFENAEDAAAAIGQCATFSDIILMKKFLPLIKPNFNPILIVKS